MDNFFNAEIRDCNKISEISKSDLLDAQAEREVEELKLEVEAEFEEWLDGQPSEYDEWQDFYGGDDWDHGQYNHAEYEWDCDLHNEF
tara:strand:- start:166 stop:426 length:261 start_codon:yes stop_codon:yes gene_type:complete